MLQVHRVGASVARGLRWRGAAGRLSGPGALLLLSLLRGTVWAEEPPPPDPSDFHFVVEDVDGYPGEVVTTSVTFHNRGSREIQGWSLAIRYDAAKLELVATRCGAATQTAQGGGAVDFCAVLRCGNALSQGVVIDMEEGQTLEPGEGYEALQLDFRLKGSCPFPGGFEAPVSIVSFPDRVCDPSSWTLVVVDGKAVLPPSANLRGGKVRCRGVPTYNQCCQPPDVPPCLFPEDSGLDSMDTRTETFRFGLYGIGTFQVLSPGLAGPTLVLRSARKESGGCGYVDTLMTYLYLEGQVSLEGDPAAKTWKVVVRENDDPEPLPSDPKKLKYASVGTVRAQPDACAAGHDFPALSEFNLFFKILVFEDPAADPDTATPDMVLFNRQPKNQRNMVCKLPPTGQLEAYAPPRAIDLYDHARKDDPEAQPVGQILGAHNPAIEIPRPPAVFVRGDCNVDGAIDISDAVYVLSWAFTGGPRPRCMAACDTNGKDTMPLGAIADAVYLLARLYLGGPALPPPDRCTAAPAGSWEALGCEDYPAEACLKHESIYLSGP